MRNFIRKTGRGSTGKEAMEFACKMVLNQGKSIRSVSMERGIPYKTLQRYVKKMFEQQEKNPEIPVEELRLEKVGYTKSRSVFNSEEEHAFVEYLKTKSDILEHFGTTSNHARKMAYEFSINLKTKIPYSWDEKKITGNDWFSYFLARHPSLLIQNDTNTSLSDKISNSKSQVSLFFKQLKLIYDRLKLKPEDIWIIDEIGLVTNFDSDKIDITCGEKHIRAKMPKKGALMTVTTVASAAGNTIPPFFVFPFRAYTDDLVIAGPTGSGGISNISGLLKEEQFMKFARHFIEHVEPTKDKPVLMLLDSQYSHLTLEALALFVKNGVTLLAFPSNSNQKLQPLDHTIFESLKKQINVDLSNWLRTNYGKPFSFYNVPEIIGYSFSSVLTADNIKSGFLHTGIYPLKITEGENLQSSNVIKEIETGPDYIHTLKVEPELIQIDEAPKTSDIQFEIKTEPYGEVGNLTTNQLEPSGSKPELSKTQTQLNTAIKPEPNPELSLHQTSTITNQLQTSHQSTKESTTQTIVSTITEPEQNQESEWSTDTKSRNILTLEERIKAIREYDRVPVYQKVADVMNCSAKQIRNIIHNRESIMLYYASKTGHCEGRFPKPEDRLEKIELLNKVMFEWILRTQARQDIGRISTKLIRTIALDVKNHVKIPSFYPNTHWLESFMQQYDITETDLLRQQVYSRNAESKAHLSLKISDIVEDVKAQRESGEKESTHGSTYIEPNGTNYSYKEEDSPLMFEDSTEGGYTNDVTYDEENDDDDDEDEIEETSAKKRRIDSSNNNTGGKTITCYEEALQHLKPLEDFVLLEENFRAIGVISQLEAIFRNPSSYQYQQD